MQAALTLPATIQARQHAQLRAGFGPVQLGMFGGQMGIVEHQLASG